MSMLTDARKISFASVVVCTGLAAVTFAACSSDPTKFDDGPGSLTSDGEAPDAQSCGYHCSADLKKVIKGCPGSEEVTSCGPDEGCGVDRCVDACQSAALSKGSIGCSFWTLPPDDPTEGPGSCFTALIANTWDRPVTLGAEYGSEALDISNSIYTVTRTADGATYTRLDGPIPPGQVAVVFLSQAEAVSGYAGTRCPEGVTPAFKGDPIRHGTAKTSAFHLTADAPISAYSMYPYGGADSYIPTATLLLPISSWDTNYIAVSTGKYGDQNRSALDRRTIQIVANEDDTRVSMRPTKAIGAGNEVDAAGKNETHTWTLSRGQVLQITQSGEVTGSPISSNKPVGLFGGSPCDFLPSGVMSCDVTQQQIPPFSQWGNEYALVPYASRIISVTGSAREKVLWMFVGAVDGTVLSYEPSKPPGAPDTLSAGQPVYFMTDALVTVKSQDKKHPFHAAVHMSSATFGGGAPGGGMTSGDPDFVNVVPSDQFLDRYVFFADYTFSDTVLTVVRRKTDKGFMPVDLDCAGELQDFQPLGSSGEYEYAWVYLTKAFLAQKFAKGECSYGGHEAHSDGTFSVTVWGIGRDASYGYAGGMGSRPINDAPAPIVN
ncbi:hypothetical protein AKJ09_04899 [Labilithrix luteola]|uniref:IgGFc-binding protein N-terminal domain-containing protein n=1 Tax=Labilithrix luteola TaxID=1391654 RepID=A0A0K1PXI5_9BACT|nr:IgGFc-binding protein [Labilithrix luteola]AKU98235.1 hypothetical protein AKJ09_04899 [Labilithrix luteola]